jgi:hypothetical protein
MLASAKGFVPMEAKIARYALGSIAAKRRFLPYLPGSGALKELLSIRVPY